MNWKNLPSWLKGGLLFTLVGILVGIMGLLIVGIPLLIGIDTMITKKIFAFLVCLTSFPLIFTIICIFAFVFRSAIFNSIPLLLLVYLSSLFLIGAILGWLVKKYRQGYYWVKGGLKGVAVVFVMSFIFLLYVFFLFLPSLRAEAEFLGPMYMMILLGIFAPIIYLIAFFIGAWINRKKVERIKGKIRETTKAIKPSNWWYLLPIFLGIIGGVIGYFLFRNKDKKFALRLLIIGVIISVVLIILQIISGWLVYWSI